MNEWLKPLLHEVKSPNDTGTLQTFNLSSMISFLKKGNEGI